MYTGGKPVFLSTGSGFDVFGEYLKNEIIITPLYGAASYSRWLERRATVANATKLVARSAFLIGAGYIVYKEGMLGIEAMNIDALKEDAESSMKQQAAIEKMIEDILGSIRPTEINAVVAKIDQYFTLVGFEYIQVLEPNLNSFRFIKALKNRAAKN